MTYTVSGGTLNPTHSLTLPHEVALISISLDVSRTPVYTVISRYGTIVHTVCLFMPRHSLVLIAPTREGTARLSWYGLVVYQEGIPSNSEHSATALFDYISAGRSTHCAFYHWRLHLSSDCCIGLEQFAGVSSVTAVVASFPQQTENRTFCPVSQLWLRTSDCADYYYVTSLFKLFVTCSCSLRT